MNKNRTWLWVTLSCAGLSVVAICTMCMVFGLFAVLLSGSDTTTTASRREPTRDRDRPYRIGQDVTVGEARWRVLEAIDLGNTLEAVNSARGPLTTPGRFIQVRFEIENLSTDQQTFAGVEITGQQGRRFEDSPDTRRRVDPNEQCTVERLNPNIPKACVSIIEVPPDATQLRLIATDLNMFSSEEAQIDLGIQ